MATVSEFCGLLSSAFRVPIEEVNKYARALIVSGDLPKAVGRSVPQIDSSHRTKLILSIAGSERPSNCVEPMRELFNAVGRYEDDLTAGAFLSRSLEEISRKDYNTFYRWNYCRVEVSRTEPLINFRFTYHNKWGDSQDREMTFTKKMSLEELEAWKRQNSGLPVSSFIRGELLLKVAFNTLEEADAALTEFYITREKVVEAARAERRKE